VGEPVRRAPTPIQYAADIPRSHALRPIALVAWLLAALAPTLLAQVPAREAPDDRLRRR